MAPKDIACAVTCTWRLSSEDPASVFLVLAISQLFVILHKESQALTSPGSGSWLAGRSCFTHRDQWECAFDWGSIVSGTFLSFLGITRTYLKLCPRLSSFPGSCLLLESMLLCTNNCPCALPVVSAVWMALLQSAPWGCCV